MQRIRFKTTVFSTTFGTLAEGDLLTCSAAHADHFVEELKVAERVVVPPPQDPAPPADDKPARRRK